MKTKRFSFKGKIEIFYIKNFSFVFFSLQEVVVSKQKKIVSNFGDIFFFKIVFIMQYNIILT